MQAHIIDGKSIAAQRRTALKQKIAGMDQKPGLAVILVGDDPASHVYVRHKIKACEETGIRSFEYRLPKQAAQAEIKAEIQALNANPDVHGILLQLPVPDHLDSSALIQTIAPEKDVDGLTTENAGRLMAGLEGLVPCTPQGAMILIKSVQPDLSGLHAVVVGRSLLFGKPMAQLLLQENCTVTAAHSKTQDLPDICKRSDILVVAVGRPEMVRADWIKPGAIVIDVGINRRGNGSLCGDVAFEEAAQTACSLTPVPGGVGPMTIACLLENTVRAAAL